MPRICSIVDRNNRIKYEYTIQLHLIISTVILYDYRKNNTLPIISSFFPVIIFKSECFQSCEQIEERRHIPRVTF